MNRICHACGCSIPLADLDQRRAVLVMRRHYCRSCSDRIASSGLGGGVTARRKAIFEALALPGFRPPPRLLAAALVTLAIAALAFVFISRRPF